MIRMAFLFAMMTSVVSAGWDPAPLDAWIRKQAAVRTLQADFVQERILPSLKQPVRTAGRLCFVRPDRLSWELGEPVRTRVVVRDGTLTLMQVDARTATRMPSDSVQAKPFTVLTAEAFRDRAAFEAAFEPVDSSVTRGIYQLTMRPKDGSMRGRIPWMFLDIDVATHELRAFAFEMPDQSRVRTIFSQLVINREIDDARFRPVLDGYQVR